MVECGAGGKADAFMKPQINAAFRAEARSCAAEARANHRRDLELLALINAAKTSSNGKTLSTGCQADAEKAFKVVLAALRRGIQPFSASVEKAQKCAG